MILIFLITIKFNNMKINILPLLGFILCLGFTFLCILALFGDNESQNLLFWFREKLVYLALAILFGYGVYYLSIFIVNFDDKE